MIIYLFLWLLHNTNSFCCVLHDNSINIHIHVNTEIRSNLFGQTAMTYRGHMPGKDFLEVDYGEFENKTDKQMSMYDFHTVTYKLLCEYYKL